MYNALRLSQCKIGGHGNGIPRSRRMKDSQVNYAAMEAIARYSASALERATVDCFLALQEVQLPPRKVQKSVMYRLVIRQPAQSASENPYKSRVLDL